MIVAEIGPNHAGREDLAFALIDAAAKAGATHVKFQAYTPEELAPPVTAPMQLGPWAGRGLYEVYAQARTPLDWLPALFKHARSAGLEPFASVFGEASLDAAFWAGSRYLKIASPEVCDLDFVRRVAQTEALVILSDGMATEAQALRAAEVVDEAQHGAQWIGMLACVSEYPANFGAYGSRLARLRRYQDHRLETGISDHTLGTTVAEVAAGMGATIFEKHLMLHAIAYGGKVPLDAPHSVDPAAFALYAERIRNAQLMAEQAADRGRKRASDQWARRLTVDGEIVAAERVGSIRAPEGWRL